MSFPQVLYTKEQFMFIKENINNYRLVFDIKNNNIVLSKILDFNLIKLIYDLNTDIYESVNLKIINETEAVINLLMKHLFKDLGLPQRYSFLNITKETNHNQISFIFKSILDEIPLNMPLHSKIMPVNKMICNCNLITEHDVLCECQIEFSDEMIIPPTVEKIIGIIIFKIFNRVKEFIEKVNI